MKNLTVYYSTPKQGILPAFFSECLDITDPVFTFDRFMEGIDLRKYLSKLPAHELGRIRYNPVNMLKTVLFGFMDEGCISLRKLEDNCKVNIRYQYLMDGKRPSYRTFGYFINTVLMDQVESLFVDWKSRSIRNILLNILSSSWASFIKSGIWMRKDLSMAKGTIRVRNSGITRN